MTPVTIPSITVEHLEERRQAGDEFLLLDIREKHELEISRLDPCTHIPMSEVLFRSRDLPTDQPIYVICRSGRRSLTITMALMLRGFSEVYNVEGGINAYAQRIDDSIEIY